MKNKLNDLVNEYINEFKIYLKKLTGKIKHFFNVSKGYYYNLKKNFKEKEKRKKYLIGSLISIFLIILIANIFSSFAYYRNNNSFSLIHAIIGDSESNKYDYVLRVFLENAMEANEYHLSSEVPTYGYTFSGYKCKNDSILNFDDDINSIASTIKERDVCYAYFDLINKTDIIVNIMVEEESGSDTYTLSNVIPAFGYTYSHYECENNNEITYDSNLHKVVLKTNKKDTCNVYFSKDLADITARIFIETTPNSQNYIERVNIPPNVAYTLNEEKSLCKNIDDERIEADIAYQDGYIEANVNEVAFCEFYLNKNE